MIKQIVQSRQPLWPLLALLHPKEQALAQFPQLRELFLQHLIGNEGRGLGMRGQPAPPLRPFLLWAW